MARIVIDANVALSWLLDEPEGAEVRSVLLQSQCVAPRLWWLEVTNVILVRQRRRSISSEEVSRLLGILDRFPIELTTEFPVQTAAAIAEFARPHQLTTYDAAYLETAMRLGLPLFTRDNNLVVAAKRTGVELVATS